MFGLGHTELIIIVLIILLLFGAKRLPQLAKGLGQGITEFKNGLKSLDGKSNARGSNSKSVED